MTTNTNTIDLHIVVAALESQGRFVGYTAVTGPLSYDEALRRWESWEQHRKSLTGSVRLRHHVGSYAVRSVADPRFAPLVGHGYADGVNRTTGYPNGDRGIVKAAKAWAKLYGYEGRSGGWIYGPDGRTVTQGWHSFALELKGGSKIAEGADGLWYVIDRELIV